MEFFKEIDNSEDIRQGDIICKVNVNTNNIEKLGVIITADCDIAQKKTSNSYNWLEIVTISEYLRGPWSKQQLRKLSEKRSQAICDSLNSIISKQYDNLNPLTHETLIKWIRKSSAEDIFNNLVKAKSKNNDNLLKKLKGLEFTVDENSDNSFNLLRSAWNHFDVSEKKQLEIIQDAFKESGGFQDYFILPNLPKQEAIGFVVMLRSMWTSMASDVYLTELDARIDGHPEAYHRLGRLNDSIRFSITQKLAFLFSRIGMPVTFESACKSAVKFNAEEFLKKNI